MALTKVTRDVTDIVDIGQALGSVFSLRVNTVGDDALELIATDENLAITVIGTVDVSELVPSLSFTVTNAGANDITLNLVGNGSEVIASIKMKDILSNLGDVGK